MKWVEFSIETTNEAIEAISHILSEMGASGFVIEDSQDLEAARRSEFGEIYELDPNDYPEEGVRIKSYLPENSFLGETVEGIKQAINNLKNYDIDIGANKVTINEVNEEDWATAWKKYYHPVKVSNRIIIKPTWEEYHSTLEDEVIIELDPGMAFGTGTHPTTVLSLQALEKHIKENDTVIDVGSGSGVLSIASVLLGAKEVFAYDLDDIAVTSTKQNAELNRIQDRITAKQNNLLEQVDMKADVVVSNILAEIIVRFIKDAWKNLKDDGLFITSGIIENKRQLVEEQLVEQGFEVVSINKLEDWISIVAKKVSNN